MDSPPKLSGETLIVHHIPLVHCQVSGGRQGGCGGSLKRSNPFSPPENLGLSRTTSLPERDVLQREALLYSSLIQTSSDAWATGGGGGGGGGRGKQGSTTSNDSSFASSNSEDQLIAAHTLPRAKARSRNPLRRNPFLLKTDDEEEEEEDEDDRDNLSGYHEDSSFHLHSDADSALDEGMAPFRLHDLGFAREPFRLHGGLSGQLADLDALRLDGQRRHGSSGSNMSMDCGEHDWGEEEEDDDDEDHLMRCGRSSKTGSCSSTSSNHHCDCCALSRNFPEAFPDSFPECQQDYASDSSCNSSDGVLVNFSAIYNKLNNGVPEKPAAPPPANLNSATDHPGSGFGPPASQRDSTRGAFYLDLHTSPTEPPRSQQQPPCLNAAFPLIHEAPASTCPCSAEHQGALDLDANCNSYHPPHFGSSGDLASCLQSQARLVVATQNYYKLVTCDLSSQSTPSPAGSSVNSCSDEHSKGSPTPTQPSEYFLFKQRLEEEEGAEEEDEAGESSRQENGVDEEVDDDEEEEEVKEEVAADGKATLEGQVYVNISPPLVKRTSSDASAGRPRSRSYDRNLDKSPSPRLGSLERMLSCPVRLSEGAAQAPPPPPRVTSFAEIARSKRRNGGSGGSPSTKAAAAAAGDGFSSNCSAHSHSSVDFSPIPEQQAEPRGLSPVPFTRCYSHGSIERHLEGAREARAKTEGGLSGSSDSPSAVVRYSKDRRPTTLPIQPFTFHHQFAPKPPQPKPLLPLLAGYVPGTQPRPSSGGAGGEDADEDAVEMAPRQASSLPAAGPPPGSVRPSPLGSYSPVRLQGAPSSGTCSTCTPSPQPPHSPSCPLSAGLGPLRSTPGAKPCSGSGPLPPTPPPLSLGTKRGAAPNAPAPAHCLHRGALLAGDTLSPLGYLEPGTQAEGCKGPGARTHNAVAAAKQSHSDFFPDYFSLTEKPPEEFCLSPDASSSSSSSCSSSQSQISVDLWQKRGLVKAVNTAVDLIVAHFGTSRDAGVKAKLGNSWVSPNVGHLILKYLCPALQELLRDGLKSHVLDLIIGQRRCQPWSLAEASTQLGPSTRVLHSLFSKVSQFSELTNHSMRLNAFIFGLLNLKSLEFWFNHLFTHEDIVAAHYNPWGFLPLSQGPCQPLFEEFLLLLQPLSLLPFDLDLLFEPRLLQKGREQLRRKEQLCSAGQGAGQSSRSTFQLMRGWSATVSEMVREAGGGGGEGRKEHLALRREGTWPRMEAAKAGDGADGRRSKGVGQESREEEEGRRGRDDGRRRHDRQAGWWYQLMQSSQVYIDQSAEGSKFVKAEKRRKSSERRQCRPPPAREGVVEGAESGEVGGMGRGGGGEEPGAGGRPSWMGSPPESLLGQEKVVKAAPAGSPAQGRSLRWGRLFGSSLGSPTRAEGAEPKARAQKTRAPSGWLGLDRSVLGMVAHTIGASSANKAEPAAATTSGGERPAPPPTETGLSACEVRALCHHIATEPGQLSFNKGDVLRVLKKADPDWLLCSLGSSRGLVPIIYVTLAGAEDGRDVADTALGHR